ncbi:MAG: response regulator [Acidobacteria bacterium]|nr:response regulator [Acidobacteriota bacterium]
MAEGKRVLVVDDDDATVAVFQKILAADHWEVDATNSSREAHEKIRSGHYQLIVSDLNMPEFSGVQLYRAAVEFDPELKKRFLFVSGYADNPVASQFLLEAGCPVIRKPIRLEEFRDVAAQIAGAQPLQATGLASAWFTPDFQYLYSGEVFSRHTIFTLLNLIHTARLTGVLHVIIGRLEKKLYFNLGMLVFATSNDLADGLGEVMLRAGTLTQRQFEDASELMRQGWKFGAGLVDLGFSTMSRLEESVRLQLTRAATSILDYAAGRYYFFESFEENITPDVAITMPLGQLILQGVRQAADLPLKELAQDEQLYLDVSPDPMVRFQDVTLNEEETRMLGLIERPVRAVTCLRNSGLPEGQAARTLYALLALGMVISVPPVKEAEAAAAPEPESAVSAAPVAPPAVAEKPVATPAEAASELAAFESDIQKWLQLAESGTYYQILEITSTTEASDIKKAFHRLARKFHPDRHMGRSEWISSLQTIMDALTMSYKTLCDAKVRSGYDKKLAETGAFAVGRGGVRTDRQASADECLEKAKECLRAKNFAGSITWLRKCVEVAPDNSKHRTMLARSLSAVPQYRKEAIEHYEAAIKLDPWNVSAYFQFAELYESMQLPWRARPLYQKILDIDPGHGKARDKLKALDEKEGKGGGEKKDSATLGKIFGKKE